MYYPIRWGIMGTGWVVEQSFLPAVAALGPDKAISAAVASRTGERAHAFAREHGIPLAIEGYDALIERDDIDAVYIAVRSQVIWP